MKRYCIDFYDYFTGKVPPVYFTLGRLFVLHLPLIFIILFIIFALGIHKVSALDFSNIKYLDTIQLSIAETATGTIDTRNETTSNRLVASKTYSTNFSSLNGFTSDVIVFGGQFLVSNVSRTYQSGTGDIIGSDTSNNDYRFYIYQDSDTPTISIDISQLIIWTINTNKGDYRCEFDKNGIVLCPYKLLGSDTTINSITVFFEFPNYADNQNLNSYNLFYYYTNIGGRVWFINYYNYDLEDVETKLQNIQDLISGKCDVSSSYLNFNLENQYLLSTGELTYNSSYDSTNSYYTGLSAFKFSGDVISSANNYGFIGVYNENKQFIERILVNPSNVNTTFALNPNYYYRFSIAHNGSYSVTYCSNGIIGALDGINQGTNDINNSINNDNVDGASSSSNEFITDFEDGQNDYGFADVVSLPLDLISNFSNNSCTPLTFNIPMSDKVLTIPCGDFLWSREGMSGIYATLSILFCGPLVYYLVIWLLKTVQNIENPKSDKIEVLKL